jgi:hypothetical protein
LLERLDWFLASISWITSYPGSTVPTLSRDTLDHYPCLILVNTHIPQSRVFRFENYWLLHDEFLSAMEHGWSVLVSKLDCAKRLMAKFKNLRKNLRCWYAQISNLATTI